MVLPVGHKAKITVTREGNTLTVTDGRRMRLSSCASSAVVKSLASRVTNDQVFATKWMGFNDPVQLPLPFDADPGDHAGHDSQRR